MKRYRYNPPSGQSALPTEYFASDDSVLNDARRALRDQWLPEQITSH